ncbi:MAG: hypothetical protein KGJ86_11575 [Chloroflexota bacterium]|nr:hypothetical protein [Chloroflexota bacterium]
MSAEFWAIVGTAITVLIATGVEHRDTSRRIDDLAQRVSDLAQRVSRLDGAFDEMKRWTKDLVEAVLHRPAA